MHDHFLSYSSSERARALAVAATLRELGQTVWMDDATTDDAVDQLTGIPVGQSHWTVIRAAIDQASTFLVLDSSRWRASAYCRAELEHARSVGKRVAIAVLPGVPPPADGEAFAWAPDDDLRALVGALEPGAALARAHARLRAEASGAGADRSRRSILGLTGEQARDAELVTTSDLRAHGLATDAELTSYCERLLTAARRRRYGLRSAVAAGLAVLLVLAFVAVAARQVTASQRAQAAEAAERARSLDLAQQALNAPTTSLALELARRAVDQDSNTSTRGALAELESEAGYRQRMAISPMAFTSAAVSDDGQVVLAGARDVLVLADVAAGTSRSLPLPEPLSRALELTADGRTGYALSLRGHLLCVDVPSRRVSVAPPEGVVALDVTSDGAVWWATADGGFSSAPGCPDSTGRPMFTGPTDVQAFAVVDDRRRVVAVTRANAVTTFGWDGGGGPGTAEPLATTVMAELPAETEQDRDRSAEPADHAPAHVTRCGEAVHVVAGVSGPLRNAAHVAFDLDGRATTGRTTNLLMPGIGCGTGGTAWTVPLLTGKAMPLPDAAPYPVGIADGRDNGSLTVVAESVGQRRTVVLHGDGRVDVLDAVRAPWGRQADDTVVAVPLREGSVLVEADGRVLWDGADGAVPVGDLGGAPDPEAVGSADRAYVAVGAQVVEIAQDGVRRTFEAPARVGGVTLSASGDEILAEAGGSWLAFPVSGDGAPREIVPPDLPEGEKIFSLRIDGERSLVTTQYGRLLLTDADGKVTAEADTGNAGALVAVFRADHGVVAIGQDGLLRSYGPRLEPERSTLFGAGGIYVRPSPDGRTLLVSLSDFSIWSVDPETLEVQRRIGSRSPDVRLVLPSPDGAFALRVLPGDPDDGTPAGLERIPLGD